MKITYMQGDLFDSDISCLVHSVNAQYRMNAGVAKIIRNKYPKAYEAYMSAPKLVVGEVIWAESENKIIANLVGQKYYGYNGARYVDYDGIRQGFKTINSMIKDFNDNRLCMPLIGAGLGGGYWSVISSIIEEECKNTQPFVYTLDGIIPQN